MGRSGAKKRILLLAAQPVDLNNLRVNEEIREIQAGLRAASLRDAFDFQTVLATRSRDLQQALLQKQPQIVHFSGHGSRHGALMLEDAVGRSRPIPADVLGELFSLCVQHVECVVLNVCYGEAQAAAIFNHIPYVVGTREQLADAAAIAFSIGFYTALGEGKPYRDAFLFGRNLFRMDYPDFPPPLLKAKPQSSKTSGGSLAAMTQDQLHQLAMQYKLSLAHGVDDAETHLSLGGIYLTLRLHDLAVQHLKKAVDLDPALADAYYLLALAGIRGRSLKHLPLQDVRGLETYLDAAIAIDGRRPQYYYLLALLKEGYYAANQLRMQPPYARELVSMAGARQPDPGEIQRLLSALPQIDPALAARLLPNPS